MSDDFIYRIDKKLSKKYFEELIKENIWKALAVIHAGIHHQMRMIHHIHKFKTEKLLINNPEKTWAFIQKKKFSQITIDLYTIGLINDDLMEKIKGFNTMRNHKLGHIDIYSISNIPSDKDIEEVCKKGMEVAIELDGVIHSILFSKK
ncbi:hypothetical protein HYX08_03395 [Candidatus Woesearchaeota archaeon]|nr:hypothetical protein [Candidatus Woesearchaeota archaeon]